MIDENLYYEVATFHTAMFNDLMSIDAAFKESNTNAIRAIYVAGQVRQRMLETIDGFSKRLIEIKKEIKENE